MTKANVAVEAIPLDSLKPYDRNAKLHPPEQIQQIANSIQQFGNNDPIGVWGKQNTIVTGHGRYEALKALGFDTALVIHLDHLTSNQRRAYALAHNQTALTSGWDFEMLELEFSDLNFDMEQFGFDTPDDNWLDGLDGNAKRSAADAPIQATCPNCGAEFEV